MVLVDTSVWVAVFSKPHRRKPGVDINDATVGVRPDIFEQPHNIEDIVDFDEICTCQPIIQEVLQGFRHERDFRVAKDSMLALPSVESPMEMSTYVEAASLYRTARKQGLTIRSSIDCLIAMCAIKHNLTVLHCDRDFDMLAKISSLDSRSIGTNSFV